VAVIPGFATTSLIGVTFLHAIAMPAKQIRFVPASVATQRAEYSVLPLAGTMLGHDRLLARRANSLLKAAL
jgi:hypothetical protein